MLNLADGLSLSRIVLLPLLFWAVLAARPWLAIVLFAMAIASDVLDGIVARRRQIVTPRGALLDHGADAIFVCATTALWAWLGLLPALLPVVIAIAFAQYAIDSGASSTVPLRASRLGRMNGIAYYVVSGAALAIHSIAAFTALHGVVWLVAWFLIVSTLISIVTRLRHSYRRRRG